MIDKSWFNVLSFLGVWTAIWLPIAWLISRKINWSPTEALTPKQKLILLASLYALAPGIIWWRLHSESMSFAELGILSASAIWYILLGLGISIVSLVLIFSGETALNLVTWQWHNLRQLNSLLLPILCLGLAISLIEELVFRGYILATLITDSPIWLGAIASSTIFALLHLVWEREETLPQLPGLWLMGLVLVTARVLADDTIYLALGLHAGWIWGLTCIDEANLVTYRYQDHWFAGIKQQPLAGVAGILCLGMTGAALWIGANFANFSVPGV
ncbi:MAG: CPBP family intramembrane glutamic endopeptidase [Cyanobacteria bacterium J06623_7]